MTDLLQKTKGILLHTGVSPRKNLSQNFLINKDVLLKQISFANISSNEIVLEIGGGTGLLTEMLIPLAKKVYCIEYDRLLAKYLDWRFKEERNIEIIHGDALEVTFPSFDKVIANLPYHISSPLTFKLLEENFNLAILMYQYEFAQRMVAEPNSDDYSRLSVNVQYLSEVKLLKKISRNNFYPKPRVDSALVEIRPKKEPLPVLYENFRDITRVLFNTKNKLVGSIIYNLLKKNIRRRSRREFRKNLDAAVKHSDCRVRNLSIDDFITITKQLCDFLSKEQLEELCTR
jgi:16S rRNA (adenine1518-N6/adenine1519-N6)-dimethyltransferase